MPSAESPGADHERVRMVLFVAGSTDRSVRAIRNLEALVSESFGEGCELEIVDVLEAPEIAERERILATPTLIKHSPLPRRRITGDLSDARRVLDALGHPRSPGLDLPGPLGVEPPPPQL